MDLQEIILFGSFLIIVVSLIYNYLKKQNTYGVNTKGKLFCVALPMIMIVDVIIEKDRM